MPYRKKGIVKSVPSIEKFNFADKISIFINEEDYSNKINKINKIVDNDFIIIDEDKEEL